MSKKEPCLHCMILQNVRDWAVENGVKRGGDSHASGAHIFNSITEVIIDVLDAAPPTERPGLYAHLIRQLFERAREAGLVVSVQQTDVNETIN
jgi:hypothetical protein